MKKKNWQIYTQICLLILSLLSLIYLSGLIDREKNDFSNIPFFIIMGTIFISIFDLVEELRQRGKDFEDRIFNRKEKDEKPPRFNFREELKDRIIAYFISLAFFIPIAVIAKFSILPFVVGLAIIFAAQLIRRIIINRGRS